MVKEQYRFSQDTKKVSSVKFSLNDHHEVERQAVIPVTSKDLYASDPVRRPVAHGVLDKRLGISSKDGICGTCDKNYDGCVGHFGYIDLRLPVFHIGFFGSVVQILQTICKHPLCARVLLSLDEMEKFHRVIRRLDNSYIARKKIRKAILEKTKKVTICPHCKESNGVVKKSLLKITYEKYRNLKKDDPIREMKLAELDEVIKKNKEMEPFREYILVKNMNPQDVLLLFDRIPLKDVPLLLMRPNLSVPSDLILTRIPVPPACIRPSIVSDTKSGTTEDDLTMKLSEIIGTNELIALRIQQGAKVPMFAEAWDVLQLHCALYINSQTNTTPLNLQQQSKKPSKGIVQRLKGKGGRFRQNLSGKRVNYAGRTVISPDPNLRIEEVGVPTYTAKILTYPERVNPTNRERLQKLIMNGADVHPGANFIEKQDGNKISLKFAKRNQAARDLKNGDVVFRHLCDGDIVLFNRQPSLHKLSIMCHKVKVLEHRTFRFNVCVCAPYNADFDGDEMNLHVPQTEEARAEALTLMANTQNLVTPRNGELIIAATQDFLTGAYLMTLKDTFFTKSEISRLAGSLIAGVDEDLDIDLPPPCIMKNSTCEYYNIRSTLFQLKIDGELELKLSNAVWFFIQLLFDSKLTANRSRNGVAQYDFLVDYFSTQNQWGSGPQRLWSGKQAFSLILRPNRKCPVKANLRTKGKSYTRGEDLCYKDSFVVIRNSELLLGSLDKSTLGSGSKNNVFFVLLCDWGNDIAAAAMWRLSRMTSSYLMNRGFSIGINDVTPGQSLVSTKEGLLQAGYRKCDEYIQQMEMGNLQCQPGFTAEETLESVMLGELSAIRDRAGNACLEELHPTNGPLVMALSGSKGSKINISQMTACVGQQAINGKRVPNGFLNRSLPHFRHHSKFPAAKGFVQNSFYSGLTATEFWFHTMGGREGLVDTAVKTAETGYLQRRMMKALEDICVQYDGTVRNADGHVMQFKYGDDGLDPARMEGQGKPLDFSRVYENVRANYPCRDEEPLQPDNLNEIKTKLKANEDFKACDDSFKDDLKEFLENVTSEVERVFSSVYEHRVSLEPYRTTGKQMHRFIDTCLNKYMESVIEPGTAVGALCSQSIGEPATQMTLKTFHFAGVASMNITQGVPRMNEILNCSKNLSTPIITAYLENDTDEDFARRVKARIEKTVLGDVCQYMEEVYTPNNAFLVVKLDLERIQTLRLEVNIDSIVHKICSSRIGIKMDQVAVEGSDSFSVASSGNQVNINMEMQTYKDDMCRVVIQGVFAVDRVVIEEQSIQGVTHYRLQIEGYNLLGVLATRGVKVGVRNGEQAKTTSNSIHAVARTLGIEAARLTILNEIKKVMEHHGIMVDDRHIMLVADVMTSKGSPNGVTRFGLAEMSDNVMNLASFEKTADHLFDAAYYGQEDRVNAVSDSIIMGTPIPLGTGIFKLLQKTENKLGKQRSLLFDNPIYHDDAHVR